MSILYSKFDAEYDVELEARGNGEICEVSFEGSLDSIYERYKESHGNMPRSLSLNIVDTFASGYDYGFTSVDSGYLERLEALKELILPKSIKEIKLTEKLKQILRDNNVLIRGAFDSYAEQFAKEQQLNFRPVDFVFASYDGQHESMVLTMMFKRDGRVVVEVSLSSSGSSAGNSLGWISYKELPAEFWKNLSVEQVAKLSTSAYPAVLADGRLADFMEKAKLRVIYTGAN
ncbi:MAG: hypothetical protein IK005_00415 [Paludibacteraceae bacterium]|nr:hypothetical protein [Paludibacteraceae bacterium]